MTDTPEARLIQAMAETDTIDSHEHLRPEPMRLSASVDVFTLFSHYTQDDLQSAGMPEAAYKQLFQPDILLEKRWELFRPFWAHIRYGSLARPALIAASKFYGCDDINDQTYHAISERIRAANTPGLYRRILRDTCRIRKVIPIENTRYGQDADKELFAYVKPLGQLTIGLSADKVRQWAARMNMPVRNLDDYLALMQACLRQWRAEGIVGLKTFARPHHPLDRPAAIERFRDVLEGRLVTDDRNLYPVNDPLRDFLIESILPLAGELGFVVAVHAGMWHDFRHLDPRHFLPLFLRYPDTKFDLYHMGMPWIRDTGVIGKNCPNVYLNLCWSHILSPVQVRSGLDEYLDLVPVNKIIGFGGDYGLPVEKVYGHLVMARENIAAVLGGRIRRGEMDFEQALHIARLWLFDNPCRIYGLDLERAAPEPAPQLAAA